MSLFQKITRGLWLLILMLAYFGVLWLGFTEQNRRSLGLASPVPLSPDYVILDIRVTSINTSQGFLTESIRLIPMGRFAIDRNTPATDIKLLVNSASGNQAVTFSKGDRIVPVDATSLLTGNPNNYPFDRYTAAIQLLVTAPSRQNISIPDTDLNAAGDSTMDYSLIGRTDLTRSERVPIRETFSASIPGIKFTGELAQDDTFKIFRNNLTIRRANNAISVSLLVMITMFLLAISIMSMVFNVTASSGEMNLLPLSLCVTLIFGLPALRSIQPGVPPVGVLGDYVSFIWDELIVSLSAITLAWLWIIRSRKRRKAAEALSKDSEPGKSLLQ